MNWLSKEEEEKLENGGFISVFGTDLIIDGFREENFIKSPEIPHEFLEDPEYFKSLCDRA